MKKILIVLFAALALIVIGTGLFFLGGKISSPTSLSFQNLRPIELITSDEEYTADSDIEYMVLDLTSADVIITPYDGDMIYIKYLDLQDGNGNSSYDFEEENGILTIRLDGGFSVNYTGLGISDTPIKPFEISVPEGELDRLQVNLSSGDLTIRGMSFADALTLKSSSGDITVQDINVASDMVVITSSGCFNGTNITAGAFDSTSSSGDVSVDGLDVSIGAKAKASSGNVTLGLTDAKSNYSITTSVSSGECNLESADNSGADKTLEVNTSSGDRDVRFGE